MNGHYYLNGSQTMLTLTINIEIPVIKNGETLTAAQYEALKNYCQNYVSGYIELRQLTAPIHITSCEIYRNKNTGDHQNAEFYDAETGKLYDEQNFCKHILDGQYEIRVKSTDATETA